MSELKAWSTNNEDFNYGSLEDLIDSNIGELAVGQIEDDQNIANFAMPMM